MSVLCSKPLHQGRLLQSKFGCCHHVPRVLLNPLEGLLLHMKVTSIVL